jgi:L-iditol 2-dehydrogenase
MKSYKLVAIDKFELFDVPFPKIVKDDDVLIKVERVGICGSDVHYYSEGKIGSQLVEYPWAVGHEGSGVVASVGAGVRCVKPGDRVAFDPAQPCGGCSQCRAGRAHTCTFLNFLGCPQQVEGCLSEYIILPEGSCLPIPTTMSMEEAAMVEPLSIAVYAVSLVSGIAGSKAAVLGAGPIGLCLLQVLKAEKAGEVYVTDKIDERLNTARVFGASWTGNASVSGFGDEITGLANDGLDFVFECCGQQDAIDTAIRLLKPGGELSIVGIPQTNRISFDISLLRRKEIRIQNVRRQNNCMLKALDLIKTGAVNARGMITHRFGFDETPQAFDLVENYRDGVIKAMIAFN